MTAPGPGNCNTKTSEVGSDGYCYSYCADGYSPVDNGLVCAKNCPLGFLSIGSVPDSTLACIKPSFSREIKPNLQCPSNADRQFDKCLLDCPVGSIKKFNLCIPQCPPNFIETPDGLSCQAEFTKRTATIREACNANETRIGGRFCLSPCSSGTVPYGANAELCYATVPSSLWPYFWTGDNSFSNWTNSGPLISKIISARGVSDATCNPNYEPLNGQCFADCPAGSKALGPNCVADCPAGFKNSSNLTACIRPSYKRHRETSFIQNIGNVARWFIGILAFLLIVARLTYRKT